MNEGGPFLYKVNQRVTINWPTGGTALGRITDRTVEAALGKTYCVRGQRGRNLGYIPESYLSLRD